MKKLIVLTFLFGILYSTQAQNMHDPKAKTILDKVSQKAKKAQPFEIDFSNRLIDKQSDVDETSKGNVKVSGANYQLKLGENIIYCNGSIVWTYYPEMEEVEIRDIKDMDEAMNPVTVFDMYKKGFKYRLKGEKKENGKNLYVIDLYPENPKDKKYGRAQILVVKGTYELYAFNTYFKDGKEYHLNLKNFKSKISVQNSDFEFNSKKFPDVEVTDLRE